MVPGLSCVGIRPREGPLDTLSGGVARLLPRIDFAIRHAPVRALLVNDGDFAFRQFQPAGVVRLVVKDCAAQQVEARP